MRWRGATRELAQRVVALDPSVDALQREIEERAILTIARRQPMAVDLREIVGALRVSNDLERIGDLAKNIAKRVIALGAATYPTQVIRGVEHMSDLVLGQLKQVLDAYARRDVGKAMEVWRGDEEIDAVNNSLFRELLTYMMEDPRNITFCTHLLFCAKNIERMGDHATNIAETVYYIAEGRALIDERPKGDTTRPRPCRSRRPSAMNRGTGSDSAHERPHPDHRGRGAADAAAALQPRGRGLRRRHLGARRRSRDQAEGKPARPAGARLDAARHVRASSCAAGCARGPTPSGCRSSCSRRAARRASGCAGLRPAPTTTSSSRSRCPSCSRASARCCAARVPSGSRACSAPAISSSTARRSACSRSGREVHLGPTEFRLLEFLMQSPGPRLHPRAAARRRLGPRHLYRRAHRRRACRAPAPRAQPRPRLRPDPHRARRRLFVRRAVRQERVIGAPLPAAQFSVLASEKAAAGRRNDVPSRRVRRSTSCTRRSGRARPPASRSCGTISRACAPITASPACW